MLSLIWLIGKWATKIAVLMTEQNTGWKTTNKGTKNDALKYSMLKTQQKVMKEVLTKKQNYNANIWLLIFVFSQSMSEYIFPMKSKINYNTTC